MRKVGSDRDRCTGNYVEELDRRYDNIYEVAHDFLSACLPKERNFTVAASAIDSRRGKIRIFPLLLSMNNAQYCTVINYAGCGNGILT